ncbi:MAG: type II secretion system protein GspE, partial [Bacteroidetes bacterium]|nr:type II secretion system protein GspE [Bacteroidota bacterium]
MVTETRKKLGAILYESASLGKDQLSYALAEQKGSGQKMGAILLKRGDITSSQLHEALAVQAGIDSVDLDTFSCDATAVELVPVELVSKYTLMPFQRTNGFLDGAMANPFDLRAIEELRLVTGLEIKRHYSSTGPLESA